MKTRLWGKKYKHKDVILASFMKGKNWKLEYQQNIIVKGSVKYDYDRLLLQIIVKMMPIKTI